MVKSKIAWTEQTWNPIRPTNGFHRCTKVSPGCLNCYASDLNVRFDPLKLPFVYGNDVDADFEYKLSKTMINKPYTWHDPRMIFVCSMMDLFHEKVPDRMIQTVFAIMSRNKRHTFQVLTKRPQRMHKFIKDEKLKSATFCGGVPDNVWIGMSAENQLTYDERIEYLMRTSARTRFVSFEPLLESINVGVYGQYINWAIIGCESGNDRRPCDTNWMRDLTYDLGQRDVPVFVKQINGYKTDKVIRDITEFPKMLRKREWPKGRL